MKTLFRYLTLSILACGPAFLSFGCTSSQRAPKEPIPVRVLIIGAVMLPGEKTFWINENNPEPPALSYAIAASGGPAPAAYLENITVKRIGFWGNEKSINVNLLKILHSAEPEDFYLKDGDIVEVPAVIRPVL